MVAAIDRRLKALEARTVGGFVPWVQIIQNVDQTEGEAIAAYEAENGPVGDSDKILWVIIRKPEWAHA